jgi:hypothetical protein
VETVEEVVETIEDVVAEMEVAEPTITIPTMLVKSVSSLITLPWVAGIGMTRTFNPKILHKLKDYLKLLLQAISKRLMVPSQGKIFLLALGNIMVMAFLLTSCGQLWILGSNKPAPTLHLQQCLPMHQISMLLMLGTQTLVPHFM